MAAVFKLAVTAQPGSTYIAYRRAVVVFAKITFALLPVALPEYIMILFV
jgi:hypothetical protein